MENRFSKEQIIKSKNFSSAQKDVLKALLKNDSQYSIEEAAEVISSFCTNNLYKENIIEEIREVK